MLVFGSFREKPKSVVCGIVVKGILALMSVSSRGFRAPGWGLGAAIVVAAAAKASADIEENFIVGLVFVCIFRYNILLWS
jgi:hypothetical protein